MQTCYLLQSNTSHLCKESLPEPEIVGFKLRFASMRSKLWREDRALLSQSHLQHHVLLAR